MNVYSRYCCIRHSILILESAAIHVCYSNSYFSSKSLSGQSFFEFVCGVTEVGVCAISALTACARGYLAH